MKTLDDAILVSNLLDYMVEKQGLIETIEVLIGLGYSDDELYYLGFEQETIDSAKEKK
jgi:hypothetical protein